MAIDTERIFLLATKKSQRVENLTYCIGVHRLGTPNMEYILGETDNNREYRQGDEVSYIYHAEYAYTLQEALDWLNNVNSVSYTHLRAHELEPVLCFAI